MIEPTETESKQMLDAFVQAMAEILREAREQPDLVKAAPHTTPARRLDDVKAVRELDLKWRPAAAETAHRLFGNPGRREQQSRGKTHVQ